MRKNLLILFFLLLFSCKEKWVCTCEVEENIRKELGDYDMYHMDEKVLNNVYINKIKNNCFKNKITRDSCEVIVEL